MCWYKIPIVNNVVFLSEWEVDDDHTILQGGAEELPLNREAPSHGRINSKRAWQTKFNIGVSLIEPFPFYNMGLSNIIISR